MGKAFILWVKIKKKKRILENIQKSPKIIKNTTCICWKKPYSQNQENFLDIKEKTLDAFRSFNEFARRKKSLETF